MDESVSEPAPTATSPRDLSAWEQTPDELELAEKLATKIHRYTEKNPEKLPVYKGAVAIDGPQTKDRDDAIQIHSNRREVVVDVFIADPTHFIKKDDAIDLRAMARKTSLYLPNNNLPMLPRILSEDALSLNAGKRSPAIRISTVIGVKSRKVEKIIYERCMVEADNVTYDSLGSRIAKGDHRFAMWDRTANWLHGLRAKNSKQAILPIYDEKLGILTTEDGNMIEVDPMAVNAHKLVAEAMILANQSAALLMHHCYGDKSGVYRRQDKILLPAAYDTKAGKHASLGVKFYTHATSPNRRAVDMLVHRHLAQLGKHYELDLLAAEQAPPAAGPPYRSASLKGLLQSINRHQREDRELQSEVRRAQGERWCAKVFPDTDPAKLKTFRPVSFSILLKSAAEHGLMNEVFCHEILRRLHNNTQDALIFPKDAVNIFRFADEHHDEHAQQWQKIREVVLEKLIHSPEMLDQVFIDFVSKIGGTFDIKTSQFVTTPSTPSNVHHQAVASTIRLNLAGSSYSTPDFTLGFRDRPIATRAKIEFLRAYGNGTLLEDDCPALPSSDAIHIARNLYLEDDARLKKILVEKGFTVSEEIAPFKPNPDTGISRGVKYTATLTRGQDVRLSVSVRRDKLKDASRIALEMAIFALRERGLVQKIGFVHTGLATFQGKLKSSGGLEYYDEQVVSPKKTRVHDFAAWIELLGKLTTYEITENRRSKSIHIKSKTRRPLRNEEAAAVVELLQDAFPKSEIATMDNEMILKNPPDELRSFVRQHTKSR